MARISEDEQLRRYAREEMKRLVRVYQAIPQDDTLEEAHWWSTIVLALHPEQR